MGSRGSGWQQHRGFTLIELMIVVAILAILAVVAVPSFVKYMRRAKTTEAVEMLDLAYKGAAQYFMTPHVAADGTAIPCQFPQSQGATPVEATCCGSLGGPDADSDDRCDAEGSVWQTATWSALNFEIKDHHYYVYAFESSGTLSAATFSANAMGDLDCDGTMSLFSRMGTATKESDGGECSMQSSAAIYVENESE